MYRSRTTFGDAFSQGIRGAGDILSQSILDKKEIERQKLAKEQLQKEQEFVLGQLLENGNGKIKPSINPKERVDTFNAPEGLSTVRQARFLSRLTPNNRDIYNDLTKKVELPKNEYINLDYNNKDAVYGFNKRTNQVEKVQDGNPLYKPKRTNTATEYNATGEKIIREFYEDGTTKDIPTGFYKKHSGDGKDKFDLDKFNKTINSFTDEDIKINKLRAEYNSYPTDELKYEINAKNESNQATLYDLMDEDSQSVVNEWYSQLKNASDKAGVDFKELEKRDQEKLKNKFIETISKSFDGSSEDYARKRALILYAKFKYNYITD